MNPDNREDRIIIKELQIECLIGVNPEERVRKQRVTVDIELSADLGAACRSDSIEDTISYSDLASRILEHAQSSSYLLIEKLAEEIARICLAPQRARSVKVVVKKPGVLSRASYAGIELHRKK